MKFRLSTMFNWLGMILLAVIFYALGGADTALASPLGSTGTGGFLFAGVVSLDQIFKVRVLTMAVNKMRPVTTRVLDIVFSRKKRQLSSLFAWDIKSSNERILKNIRVAEAAQVTNGTNRKTVTCEAPRFAEKRLITAASLDAARKAGEAGVLTIQEKVADEQSDMRGDVDRTREFMAVKCVSGTVVDESGAVIVDYNFQDAQRPVLADGKKWDQPTGLPITDMRAWKKWIKQRAAVDSFVAICGSAAMDALIESESVGEKMKWVAGQQIAEEGRIARLAGVIIEEYEGSYKDQDGVIQDLLPANAFVLIGIGSETAAELYAPVVDFSAEGGVGGGKEAEIFFSKAWDEEDPSGKWLKVESRPLPVLFQPECVIYATVCDLPED